MMTVEEHAAYQRHSEEIITKANELNAKLPYGVKARLAFNYKDETGKYKYLKHLQVCVFKDIIDAESVIPTLGDLIPADGKIMITTVAEKKEILGKDWEYVDFKV